MATPIIRTYSSFRGVDFTSDPAIVNLSRSPDALNVWKNYEDTQGECIETRPGYQQLGNFEDYIYGFYIFKRKAIIHAGTNLYLWDNFPSEPEEEKTILKNDMNEQKTSFAIFDDKLYILDGLHYLVYDGEILQNVVDTNPYIPTTSIGRDPSGGGELLEDINLLSPYRKNSFLADGTSTQYCLDAQDIEEVTEVKVNDVVVNNYTVNELEGKVIFNTAPIAPQLSNDNVVITFRKTVEGYAERIAKCKIVLSFDRRLFFTGNPDYPNALFNSQLNDPSYISDLDYYQDGSGESAIKSMAVGNNVLWVFKEPNQQNETIFYHTPTYDAVAGKIYPSYQGNISTGCYSESINYKDDIVFISRNGLEGVSSSNIDSKQLLNHRSSLVDAKLINENNLNLSMMVEWRGYLLILVNSSIYLADMRQMYSGTDGYEYEWYYWKFSNDNICLIKEYEGKLYLGAEDGSIFIVQGANDNGVAINSYWTTPMDNFGYGNHLKTTNKRGGIVKIKTIPNGRIKVEERTNKKATEKSVKEFSSTGFDYSNIDYSNFAYTTTASSNVVYRIKEKKFVELSLKFGSNELNKPFGIYSATIEAFVGGYVKR
jgi:hypothetical protein